MLKNEYVKNESDAMSVTGTFLQFSNGLGMNSERVMQTPRVLSCTALGLTSYNDLSSF